MGLGPLVFVGGDMGTATKRKATEVVAAVRPIATKLATARGLELWDVTFAKEAGRETLTIACDRKGGISSGELAELAEEISRELDHVNVVPGDDRYVLDVSSPGAERSLAGQDQFAICEGRRAKIVMSGSEITGDIGAVHDDSVQILTPEPQLVAFDDIQSAHLVVEGIG